MRDKDRHICALDKEGNCVRQGQRYMRARQGEQLRAKRTDIIA